MKQITDYLAEVKLLLQYKLANELDEAILKAGVPKELHAHIKESLGIDVQIKDPSILKNTLLDEKTLIKVKAEHLWTYTEAYSSFLKNYRRWNPSVVDSIIHSSSKILERFPDTTNEKFTTKGLVVGYVQSGKTASMASLINLAADHGYKLVIVLAGLLKDLRLQTQNRMDQEITGASEEFSAEEMIQHRADVNKWVRLTKADIDSDFRPGSTQWDASEHTPKLIVMKKIPSIINSLSEWIRSSPHMDLKKFPVLIIDDESDHATIDTNYSQVDDDGNPVPASKTNEAIRELVKLFPKCVYVGYTATPFANFFIDAVREDDLYPRDFICVLEEPKGYWGARQLFGLGMSPSGLSSEEVHDSSVDLIEIIDSNEVMQYNQNENFCPSFLREALYSFILTSLARLARGQDGPKNNFAMLVHPSRLKDDHEECKLLIEAEIEIVKNKLRFPNKPMCKSLLQEFKNLWDTKFLPKTKEINDKECPPIEFDHAWKFHKNFFDKLDIIALNSKSGEKLSYNSHEQKIYIVVGGDKLSRGLTLEGLCISVFFRNLPNAYDTSLQMSRWFGYRKGYYDLTRVFVEERVADAYADLARVELELRHDLKKYAKEPNPPTPLQLFPLVRSHPSMAVTSRLKYGAGRQGDLSFQATTTQTVTFPLSSVKKLRENINLTRAWIKDLGKPFTSNTRKGTYFFKDLSPDLILEFLTNYQFSEDAREINSHSLTTYIKNQNRVKELLRWDVIFPVGTLKNPSFSWDQEIVTHSVNRSRFANKTGNSTSIKILSEGPDIQAWYNECGRDPLDPTTAGLFIYLVSKDSYKDDPKKCLFHQEQEKEDILGFVIVFPRSSSHATVGYVTQR